MDDFTKLEWRQHGYKFSDISAKAQGFVRQKFHIPVDAVTPIPDRKLSVLDLISTKLPPISLHSAFYMVPAGHSFFSIEDPSDNYLDILSSGIVPPKNIVAELLSKATQQWMDSANSICIPGNISYLPLWALQVWIDIYIVVLPACDVWQKAIIWLQQEELLPFQEQIHSIFRSLSTLSWSGNILSALPGKTSFPKSILTGYLSRDWMTDEHVDQMIYLLESEVKKTRGSQRFHFLDTILIRKLCQA